MALNRAGCSTPHISDQYGPFNTKEVNVGMRNSTYVLDGLLYHESDWRIKEHYTGRPASPTMYSR